MHLHRFSPLRGVITAGWLCVTGLCFQDYLQVGSLIDATNTPEVQLAWLSYALLCEVCAAVAAASASRRTALMAALCFVVPGFLLPVFVGSTPIPLAQQAHPVLALWTVLHLQLTGSALLLLSTLL